MPHHWATPPAPWSIREGLPTRESLWTSVEGTETHLSTVLPLENFKHLWLSYLSSFLKREGNSTSFCFPSTKVILVF
jgi:hypothetical protein